MTFYNQNPIYYNPAVSGNILFDNNVTKGVTASEIYSKAPERVLSSSIKNILGGREPVEINDSILKFKGPATVAPKIFLQKGNLAIIEYEFKTVGWVNPRDLLVQFTSTLQGQGCLPANVPFKDSYQASKHVQAPFCMLNHLQEVEGWIGTRKENMFIDPMVKRNILALKSIMCLRPRTKEEWYIATTAGLPCTKTTIATEFEDEDIALVYDNRFMDLIANIRSNPAATTNFSYATEYPFQVFLKDLFPFVDSEQWLPPNTLLHFNFKFNTVRTAFDGTANKTERMNCIRGGYATDTTVSQMNGDVNTSTLGDATKNYICYNYYQLKDESQTIPPTIQDVWGYKLHQYRTTTATPGQVYSYVIPNIIQPTSIIFYLTPYDTEIQSSCPIGTSTGQTLSLTKMSNSNGYWVGANFDSFKITLGAENFVDVQNMAPANTAPFTTLAGWVANQSAYTVMLGRLRDRQHSIDHYIPTTIKLNQQDNITPIEFYLQPQDINTLDQRPLPFGSSALRISFTVKGSTYYKNTTATGTGTYYTNCLPPNVGVNFLLKYPYQILHTSEQVYSFIAPPYMAETVSEEGQMVDIATN